MPDITLVRHDSPEFTEAEKAVVRRFLFGFVDGLGESNRRMWRRFWWQILNKLEIGEVVSVKTNKTRSGVYHRRSMKLIHEFFESQERFDDSDRFLTWLKLGAGFADFVPGPDGTPCALPRSISFSAMEDGEFREFFTGAVRFIRSEHFSAFLWPHLDDCQRWCMVEGILERFEE